MTYHCPVCGEPMHPIYFGGEFVKWRCMSCDMVFMVRIRGKTGIVEGERK